MGLAHVEGADRLPALDDRRIEQVGGRLVVLLRHSLAGVVLEHAGIPSEGRAPAPKAPESAVQCDLGAAPIAWSCAANRLLSILPW